MGEPKNLISHMKEDKKKITINLANGGGVGVGIVFIGGALATAALVSVLTVGKRLLKSNSTKNRNHCPSSTGSTETSEKFIAENIISTNEDESKGLYQSLSNGVAKTGMTETDIDRIYSKILYPEEKQNLEPYSGKGDPVYDDKEILLSKTEEFSFIVIEDKMLFQNENMKVSAEKAETDQNDALVLQSNKEQMSPSIDDDEDSNSTGCLSSKSSISVDQDLLVPLLQDDKLKSDSEEGSTDFDMVKTLEGAEAIKAVHVEKKCDQHQVWLITETAEQLKRDDETLEAVHHDRSLTVQTVELLEKDEKLDADQEEVEGKSSLRIVQAEVIKRDDELDADQADEEKFDKHDGSLTVEEDKALEPAEGKDETNFFLMLEKEITVSQHDNEIDVAKLADAIAHVSSSLLQKQPTEELGSPPIDSIQEDHYVPDMITFEEVESQCCGVEEPKEGVPSLLKSGSGSASSFELLSEASETKEENVYSEPASEESEDGVTESDIHPLKQSVATTESDNLDVTGEMEMSEEDNSINDDTDHEANITDKVEDNSEGTGDSSAEYNTEPIWPAESLGELSKDSAEVKHNDQKKKQQEAEENKTIQTTEKTYLDRVEDHVKSLQSINEGTDNSKMAFLEKYMLGLAAQNVQQANSPRPRVLGVTWLFMVLSWALSFWCFGLPFLKIFLIVILVILLSKIQGI